MADGPSKGGRPPGAVNVKTQEVAARIIADGRLLPLEVLILSMRSLWERAHNVGNPETADELMMRCVAVADKAAPYLHAKLATTTVKGDADNPLVVQQETTIVDERKPLDAFIAEWVRPAIESSASEH
jgi:hypothetical protein